MYVDLDLGIPKVRVAGFQHPAVLVTAQRVLDSAPSVVHVVPLTSTVRTFHSEVVVEPDSFNGLATASSAQRQLVRSVSPGRIVGVRGNVGAEVLAQVRETIAVPLDMG